MAKRHIIKDMTINEVSSVDRPAQSGARAVIMKRSGEMIEKRAWLTTSIKGHAHLVDESNYEGRYRDAGDTSWSQEKGEDNGHSHPWVRMDDGSIQIGEANGHTHEVVETSMTKATAASKETTIMIIKTRAELDAAIQKARSEGDNVTVATVTAIHKAASELKAEDALPAEGPLAKAKAKDKSEDDDDLAQMKAKMKRMEKRDALSAPLRKHYDALADDAARDAFLEKDAADQSLELEKAAGDDPVVYTTLDGMDIRKSAGDGVISALKSADKARGELAVEKAARINGELEKRAEKDLGNLGGTMAGKKALLKALDSIEDEEVRKSALEVITSAETLAKKGDIFERRGSRTPAPIEKSSSEGQLEDLAKKRASEKSISFEKAYNEVLDTAEGQRLYADTLNGGE